MRAVSQGHQNNASARVSKLWADLSCLSLHTIVPVALRTNLATTVPQFYRLFHDRDYRAGAMRTMYAKFFCLLACATKAQAHMSLWYPGPLGGAKEANKASTDSDVDPELNFPLGCCDSNGKPTVPSPGVCRGHLDLFVAEIAQVTWKSGQDAYFQLSDYIYTADVPGSTHDGGSCQVGFSTDRGETWRVAASYNGNCPLRDEDGSPEAQTFNFKVPTGMPEGKALFAWVWLNREHEFFMNCAAVQIEGRFGRVPAPDEPVQLSSTAIQSAATPSTARRPQKSDEERLHSTMLPGSSGRAAIPLSHLPHSRLFDEQEGGADVKIHEEKTTTDESSLHQRSGDDRHHQTVQRMMIDKHECEIELAAGIAECHCMFKNGCSPETRALTTRKALRMARRDVLQKRAEACDWDSAPSMVVSYYTADAACAPNAKLNVPESDEFEVGWDEACGNVEGDGEFPIEIMDCGMHS